MERVESSAHGLHHKVELIIQLFIIEHDAASDQIRVASDVLSHRVHNDGRSKKKWVLVYWSHKGVVNNEDCTMCFALFRNHFNIKDFKCGICGSFEPNHFGVGSKMRAELCSLAKVLEADFNVGIVPKNLAEITLGATVNVVNAKNVITLLA